MAIKVRAKKAGFYGGMRRREGEAFFIESEKELGGWMQQIEEKGEAKAKAPAEAASKSEPADKSEGGTRRRRRKPADDADKAES